MLHLLDLPRGFAFLGLLGPRGVAFLESTCVDLHLLLFKVIEGRISLIYLRGLFFVFRCRTLKYPAERLIAFLE